MLLRLCIFAALMACSACRKPPAAGGKRIRFAIEYPALGRDSKGPSQHFPVPDTGFAALQIAPSSLTEISWRARTPNSPDELQLGYSTEGDVVKIRTSAVIRGYDYRKHTPTSLYQELATHTARLNQSVNLTELEKLGYLPLTIKVVSAKPPPRLHPQLISQVRSLSAEFGEDEWDNYAIALHNISSHTIRAYVLGTERDHADAIVDFPPGKTQTELYSVNRPNGLPIVVLGVLLDNGSYEGNASVVAPMKALVIARETQARRIAGLAKPEIDAPDLDDYTRRDRIRREVNRLSEEPDPAMIRAVLAGLPFTKLDARTIGMLRQELQNTKFRALATLNQPDLKNWWNTWSGQRIY